MSSRAPNIVPPTSMPARELNMSGPDRAEAGCIITAREQDTGEVDVLHARGSGALRTLCAKLDARPGDWRVLCFSTPTTIYRDLQGTRKQEWQDQVQRPEHTALSRIGRLDLLDSSLDPTIPRGRTHF